MTNIKNIGKELLGKSLNSFHKKTGLTQLEENNKMQDGILSGILSQVDDAYIEKTEQSNVIHLDGSGDGAVILDSIEGNTIVNLVKLPEVNERTRNTSSAIICLQIGNSPNSINLKTNATYTCFVSYDIKNISSNCQTYMEGQIKNSDNSLTWFNTSDRPNSVGSYRVVKKVDTSNISKTLNNFYVAIRSTDGQDANATIKLNNIMFLEGDWTDKEIPPYFEGLQSSFEEKINDEGRYEIEILSKTSKNLFNLKTVNQDWGYGNLNTVISSENLKYHSCESFDVSSLRGKRMYAGCFRDGVLYKNGINFAILYDENKEKIGERFEITSTDGYIIPSNAKYMRLMIYSGGANTLTYINRDKYVVKLEPFVNGEKLIEHKYNKIKLLINEPLRSTTLGKDRLCIVDGKLMIERKNKQIIINGEERYKQSILGEVVNCAYFEILDIVDAKGRTQNGEVYCDRLPSLGEVNKFQDKENIFCDSNYNLIGIKISRSKLTTHDIDGIKTYFRNNNTKLCYPLKEPYYEEVLNEYGEPILLEGYENGTIYIDSTIVPTTTVRYTPKMESFKTVKEVKDSNIMLTSDINDAIIPYMLEVDMMILEKEMAIMSHKNIRKIGEKDMTSMQKRTYDMLARLIKGKTLNEQECKTRVTVYLNAGKITDEQAKELNFLIDEIYA